MVISNGKLRYIKHIISSLPLGLEIRMEGAVIITIRRLNDLHMLNCLLFRTRHRYLGRFILETIHHTLQTLNFLLLRNMVLHLFFIVLLLAGDKLRIITRITLCGSILNLVDHINHIIKKHSVMGYNNNRLRIVLQISFQPSNGCNVQVVGWLVQKQDIRLTQQQLDKRNLRLLSSGKITERFLSLFLGETEFSNQYFILFLKVITAIFLEGFFHHRIAMYFLVRVIGFQFLRSCFQFFLSLDHRLKHFTDFLLQCEVWIVKCNLLQISNFRIPGLCNGRIVRIR